jgi:predicted GTPase
MGVGVGIERRRIVILGAAGRDFHDFLMLYRDDPSLEVVAFTGTQIPGIETRRFPADLAGPHYADGIPILAEAELETLSARERVDEVVLAYSDLSHAEVMHLAARALATGADFTMPGPRRTMLESRLPVIAVSAVRTGCGKSQTARFIAARLAERGVRPAVLRHPMPYGDLSRQRVQRFATRGDLDAAACTAEEREEYEPYLESGGVVFAGVDYAAILAEAELQGQVVLWDGGNNDFPFVRPDLHVVIVDALRPDQVASHHPGETCLRMADVIVVNKVQAAGTANVQRAIDAVRALRPDAPVIRADSPVELADPEAVRGRRAVVVDDGPTLTHGGMAYGAGFVAASAAGAEILDPRPWATAPIRRVYQQYPHLGLVLPAVGYGAEQIAALRETLEASAADVIVSGTPLDLGRLLSLSKPVVRARYSYRETQTPGLGERVDAFLDERGLGRG